MKSPEFELEITEIAFGGRGVGRHEGKVVFVPHVLPGEIVRVLPKKERPKYTSASLQKILKASPERIESDCLVLVGQDTMGKECFAPTPGCTYQYFSYPEEVRVKNRQFAKFLEEYAEPLAPTPAPDHLNYRNKIILHTMDDHGQISLGYCEEKGSEVLDMPNCPLALPEINNELCEIRNTQGFEKTIRDGMTVTLRYTENDGVVWWRNNPPANASWLKENTAVGKISVPVGSFFQVNMAVADILIGKVMAAIKDLMPDSVIDLYCGCGLFSIAAAQAGVYKISGLDCDDNTINAANYNARQHQLEQACFSASFADKAFGKFIDGHQKRFDSKPEDTVLIVDPPRGGLGKKVRATLKTSSFKAIIYISCAPDTLSRDLQTLHQAGYRVASAEMLDMFPRTSHFESLIVLQRS